MCVLDSLACEMHDNIVSLLPGVESVEECRVLCQEEPACTYMSHFGNHSYPFSRECILFDECDTLHSCQVSFSCTYFRFEPPISFVDGYGLVTVTGRLRVGLVS